MINKFFRDRITMVVYLVLAVFYLFSGAVDSSKFVDDTPFVTNLKKTSSDFSKSKSAVIFSVFTDYQVGDDIADEFDVEYDLQGLYPNSKLLSFILEKSSFLNTQTTVLTKCKIPFYILFCNWKLHLMSN